MRIVLHLMSVMAVKGFVSADSSAAAEFAWQTWNDFAWQTPLGAPVSPFNAVSVPCTAVPGVTG